MLRKRKRILTSWCFLTFFFVVLLYALHLPICSVYIYIIFFLTAWESVSTNLHFLLLSISCCLQTHWLLYSEFLSSCTPLLLCRWDSNVTVNKHSHFHSLTVFYFLALPEALIVLNSFLGRGRRSGSSPKDHCIPEKFPKGGDHLWGQFSLGLSCPCSVISSVLASQQTTQ